MGYHVTYLEEVDAGKVVAFSKYLVAISILYFASVNLPKFAILTLYRQLFPNKGIRIVVYTTAAGLVALTVTNIVALFLACRPFAANWDPKLPGAHCFDKEALFRWGSVPNIITDIILLILPVKVVWNLHTTNRLKAGLTLTFAVGSL